MLLLLRYEDKPEQLAVKAMFTVFRYVLNINAKAKDNAFLGKC